MKKKFKELEYKNLLIGEYLNEYNRFRTELHKESSHKILVDTMNSILGKMVYISQYFEFTLEEYKNLFSFFNKAEHDIENDIQEVDEFKTNIIKGLTFENKSGNLANTIKKSFCEGVINKSDKDLFLETKDKRNYYIHHHFVINPFLDNKSKDIKFTILDIHGLILLFQQNMDKVENNFISKYNEKFPNFFNYLEKTKIIFDEFNSMRLDLINQLDSKNNKDSISFYREINLWVHKLIGEIKKKEN